LNVWLVLIALLAGSLSWALTGIIRNYAVSRGMVDVPNERSSHVVITPRGGGLAIVITFLGGAAVLAALGALPAYLMIALGGGGLLIAGVGWLDDRKGLSAVSRAVVHLAAAVWAVYWLGGLPWLDLGFTRLPLHLIGALLAVIGVVWLVNLFNFMDGIDGIAGVETISVCVMAGAFAAFSGASGLAMACLLLVLATAGFLGWNWPPAKIFMGDVGSGFLGYTLVVLAISSEKLHAAPLFVWIVLLGVFLIDATATLIRRISRGERWYEAHRTHAYQYAVQAGFTHQQVTLAVLGLNLGLGMAGILMFWWPRYLLVPALIALGLLTWLRGSLVGRFTETTVERGRSIGLSQMTKPL
jgi:Fuc2NAc and GlcNAc transferase